MKFATQISPLLNFIYCKELSHWYLHKSRYRPVWNRTSQQWTAYHVMRTGVWSWRVFKKTQKRLSKQDMEAAHRRSYSKNCNFSSNGYKLHITYSLKLNKILVLYHYPDMHHLQGGRGGGHKGQFSTKSHKIKIWNPKFA